MYERMVYEYQWMSWKVERERTERRVRHAWREKKYRRDRFCFAEYVGENTGRKLFLSRGFRPARHHDRLRQLWLCRHVKNRKSNACNRYLFKSVLSQYRSNTPPKNDALRFIRIAKKSYSYNPHNLYKTIY